jgi:Kef-type K+ transport system membrane component KefB
VPLLTSLLLLIVLARLLGQLMVKFRQPALVGEMLAGVMLGPACLQLIHPNPALTGISELAVFLVILSAGLEMNFKEVIAAFRGRGLLIAALSFVIPLVAGLLTGIVFRLDVMRTVFLGLSVSITALPVAVRILSSFKLLNSDIARYSIASAILNDVAALLALGVILNLPDGRSFELVGFSILQTGGKLAVLAAMILGFNRLVHWVERKGVHIERIPERLIEAFGSEALLGIVIAFVLTFSSVSEILGFHFVVGAFFGALLIDKEFFLASRYVELEKTIGSVTNGFLAPVFFAHLGLQFDVSGMQSLPFILAVLIVSIGSKILSGWLGGKLSGLSRADSLGIGIILNGRGVMGLVIASIAFEKGFIGQGLFSTLVLMSIVTTVLAPVMFRKWVMPQMAGSD